MIIMPYVVITLISTCVASIKFRKQAIVKKNITSPLYKSEKRKLYQSSLTPEEIEKIEQYLNFSAFHL